MAEMATRSREEALDLVPIDGDRYELQALLKHRDPATGWAKVLKDEQGKIVGMICHAGLVGISAGIVAGHQATGSLGIKDDIENAGGTWADAPAFRDGNQVWGRVVADIPDFCRELVDAIASM